MFDFRSVCYKRLVESLVYSGDEISYEEGDSILLGLLRAGVRPKGCLCLGGDCPNCLATVDGVAYVRTCQTAARAGMVVEPHPIDGYPVLPETASGRAPSVEAIHTQVVVIGGGKSGTAEAGRLRAGGAKVVILDAGAGQEVIGIYLGPLVVARTPEGMIHLHAGEVVVATGAAEIQPICPGSDLVGILTARATERLAAAGIDLGRVVAVGEPPAGIDCHRVDGWPIRFEGTDRVEAVVVRSPAGAESRHPGDSISVGLGLSPRDALARMAQGLNVRVVGEAALPPVLPPPPAEGIICPCAEVSVADLESVWERGFRQLELIKRATLAGTGTCQGAVCSPHLRSFVTARRGEIPAPITARPLTRQATLAEVAAGFHLSAYRRTTLHDQHVALGGRMDRFGSWWRPWNYGDTLTEYRAVRETVSVMDVGTLGKLVVSGPDIVQFLERLYPCRVADLAPGRARYALLLDERGYTIDDGLVCRDTETQFFLTFTSGGASFAEGWVRDWIETWGLDVRVADLTAGLGAINVTGPRSKELLARAGLTEPPRYLSHDRADVAGIPCRIFRLGFTGEQSFELHHPAGRSVELWRALFDLGADLGIHPHGIDALFALRLEKGHVIIGMDTEFDSTPRRLGMEWAAKLDKPDFVGRQALVRTNRLPLDRQLVGLETEGPAPIEGSVLSTSSDPVAGWVTSSRYSMVLGKTVMLGWLKLVDGLLPEEAICDGRTARRVTLPFYDPEGLRARG